MARPVPVTILTGFLGAGKSTLVNRLLKHPALSNTAVIINEFGDVGIDHLLVERSGDSIIELSDGCLCCTVRGALIDTLADLVDRVQTGRIAALDRILIETTGLADPAPVMQSVIGNPVLAGSIELDGVVTVVDAVNGLATLADHEEAVKQAAVADRLIVSKRDLAEPVALARLLEALKGLNPTARLAFADEDDVASPDLMANGLYDPASKMPDVARWLADEAAGAAHSHHDHDHHDHAHHHHGHDHHHQHDAGQDPHDITRHSAAIRSFSIVHDQPIRPMALEMFIDLLRSAHADKLLRMKAIVHVAGEQRPVVLHGVQAIFHPPVRLPAWPDPSDRRTRMVMIVKDLPEAFVRDLFAAFVGTPAVDRADAQALTDNPLAVPGLRF